MVGAAGISAFPMSARVIHKMGLKEDPNNFLLMHAVGAQCGRSNRLCNCWRNDYKSSREVIIV